MAARERASRGQQKVLILALRLGQMALVSEEAGATPVFLMDDVASELDAERRSAATAILQRVAQQAFVTATEESLCPGNKGENATFRISEGEIERREE
jgi:DNA replication and repair protein RecF